MAGYASSIDARHRADASDAPPEPPQQSAIQVHRHNAASLWANDRQAQSSPGSMAGWGLRCPGVRRDGRQGRCCNAHRGKGERRVDQREPSSPLEGRSTGGEVLGKFEYGVFSLAAYHHIEAVVQEFRGVEGGAVSARD